MNKKDKAAEFIHAILKQFKIKVKPKTEDLLVQIFKFGIVGGTAFILDFAFLYFFREICKFSLLFSNTLSFS